MIDGFEEISNMFPAGEYYIGDFCYLLDEQDYDAIVCSFKYDGVPHKYKDFVFLFADTAYGDGQYSDNQGNSCYSVDSGTIGIINLPTEELKQKAKQLMKDNSANVVYFDTPFVVRVHDDVFMFGHVIIDTNDQDNYDDCDY